MKPSKRKTQKRKKSKKRKAKKKQVKAHAKSIPTFADYYRDDLFETYPEWSIPHPNHELWIRRHIENLLYRPLSTQSVILLEELYQETNDVVLRALLAKRIHILRRDYLQSFREYSDRALILLAEREKMFDKWEGIHILGCFGGSSAVEYLRKRLDNEKNQLMIRTIKRALYKIEKNIETKAYERG
ncbi:MAG: hypothetical protein ACE5IW_00910 [bacterium]